MKKVVRTANAEETEAVGKIIGGALRGGEVIELISDLGGGKTTLTRGLVVGAGSDDHVSSPTFTISNVYNADPLTIHHFDFYRLHDAGLMEFDLEDIVGSPHDVVIVEWSDVVAHVLPEDRLKIQIESSDDEGRIMTVEYPQQLTYLVEKL